jgi:hypothetical protein
MPEIQVTEDQRERLRALQRRLEEEIPSPYATVRPGDAVAYLLDRHVEEGVDPEAAAALGDASAAAGDDEGVEADDEDEAPDEAGDDEDEGDEADDDGGLPSGPMNLLADHDDVWREGGGEARYEVDLPDGSTAEARTKGDVRALLFEHYR